MNDTSRIHDRLSDYTKLLKENVKVVYHPERFSSWERADFQGEDYDESVAYNHRTIFPSEVVIEYDDDDKMINWELAQRVSKKLTQHYIPHSLWTSGNKSTHIHAFFNLSDEYENKMFLKRLIMDYFGQIKHRGTWYEPDKALAGENHLVRAEYGVHEKTGDSKSFVDESAQFPSRNSIPNDVWDTYDDKKDKWQEATDVDMSEMVEDVYESDGFKWLMDSDNLYEVRDGRKRGLFILGNVLRLTKFEDDEQGLKRFLKQWYDDAGGRQLNDRTIEEKVDYWQDRGYTPGHQSVQDLLSDIKT